jgi:CTP synthase (UTP-ammonia lyase)
MASSSPALGRVPTRIALVGDRSPAVSAHSRIVDVVAHFPDVDLYWLPTTDVTPADAEAFDGVWVVPGSPYADEERVVAAIRAARSAGTPLLGTCGGYQHMLLELARNVVGLRVRHAESTPGPDDVPALITPLACTLVGHSGQVDLAPGTFAASLLGERTFERYHCAFGLAADDATPLVAAGMVVSGRSPDGAPRVVELPTAGFWFGTAFQPELADAQPHPVIEAFVAAAREHASTRGALHTQGPAATAGAVA